MENSSIDLMLLGRPEVCNPVTTPFSDKLGALAAGLLQEKPEREAG